MRKNYTRVIPRDLFNEAKLLKCIGQLVLLILHGKALNGMTFDHDGDPFDIQLMDDGYLCVTNLFFLVGDEGLQFKSLYNSKSAYPLYCERDYCEYLVFDEWGTYTDEFRAFCNSL